MTVIRVRVDDELTERIAEALRAAFHDEITPGHGVDAYACWQCDTARAAVVAALPDVTDDAPVKCTEAWHARNEKCPDDIPPDYCGCECHA